MPKPRAVSASPRRGDADGAAAAKLVTGLEALNKELSVPTPAELRHQGGRLERQDGADGEQALASGSPGNNPRVPDAAEIVALYREVWTGAPANV